jgi:hypothetical protein
LLAESLELVRELFFCLIVSLVDCGWISPSVDTNEEGRGFFDVFIPFIFNTSPQFQGLATV